MSSHSMAENAHSNANSALKENSHEISNPTVSHNGCDQSSSMQAMYANGGRVSPLHETNSVKTFLGSGSSVAMHNLKGNSHISGHSNTTVQSNMVQRRYYWRMRCTKDGVHLQTTDVKSEFELEVAKNGSPNTIFDAGTDLDAAYDAASDANSDSFGDYTEERLSQEIERSSQMAEASSDFTHSNLRGPAMTTYKSRGLERALGDKSIELSDEQKAVLHLVLNTNKNVFFTGAAGTGKSVLLRCMIALLKEKYRGKVYVAAYTGIAACNIGGTTLHRWAGIGIGNQPVDQLVKRVCSNRKTLERWRNTKVLLIDEVSMLSVSLLKKLEHIARCVRRNDLPFGGIQIICTGDLFQLPPIDQTDSRFCFEAEIWDTIIDRTVNLTQVFRQKDPRFANILNEMRMGHVSKEANELMCSLARPPHIPKGLVPTRLFPTRTEVSNANKDALDRINGTEYEYDCEDWKKPGPEAQYIDIEKHTIAERRITLKVGAQVMLIKNLDDTLVNGSIGRVVGFMTNGLSMASEQANYEEKYNQRRSKTLSSRFAEDYPTTAAELLGIPKSKMGDDDTSGMSEAMQRKRLLAERISDEAARHTSVVPVVRFVTTNNTVRFLMVQPETWEVTNVDGDVIASRTQIPLILAWALSVHKSQGQTLPYVSVNLARIFEYGQAYVAISRAVSLDGLQVLNFAPHKITASRVVTQFYDKLAGISEDEITAGKTYFEEVLVDSREADIEDSSAEVIANSDSDEELKVTPVVKKEDVKLEISGTAEKKKPYLKKELTESPTKLETAESGSLNPVTDIDGSHTRSFEIPASQDLHPRASFAYMSSQPPRELGDSNENMFSEFNSDDIDYVNNSLSRISEGQPKYQAKRRRAMVFSSSQSQAQ